MGFTGYKNTAQAVCSMFEHAAISTTRADGKTIWEVSRRAPFKGKTLHSVECQDIDHGDFGVFPQIILFPDRSFIAFRWDYDPAREVTPSFMASQTETRDDHERVEAAYLHELTDPRVTGQNTNSAILWEGASQIDGEPIVVIATGLDTDSKNGKTGAMVQTWILRQDVAPAEAVNTGKDASICGSCPHMKREYSDGKKVRTCYVNLRTPSSIWKAYKAGSYAHAGPNVQRTIRASKLRLGSYGDPAAAPASMWAGYTPRLDTDRTGYTHQWNATGKLAREMSRDNEWYKRHLMASVDSVEEMLEAQAQGWRTFLVLPEVTPETSLRLALSISAASETSIRCPSDASIPEDKRVSCADCGACHGNPSFGEKRSVYIGAHGPTKKRIGLPIL